MARNWTKRKNLEIRMQSCKDRGKRDAVIIIITLQRKKR